MVVDRGEGQASWGGHTPLAGRKQRTPKAATDATIIRVTDSVIQVADKSSGGKKQRFLRAQEAWEDRVTDPVERRGRRDHRRHRSQPVRDELEELGDEFLGQIRADRRFDA